jgi:bifunctional non-homologous end joining protein LigD
MVFDLDPSGDDFAPVKATAQALREQLEKLELSTYVKTSGSRGLHVVVPLKRELDFDAVRAFARRVAEVVVAMDPEHCTLEARKVGRRGRVFVDTNRDAYAQTVAPAYAVRARRRAPISVPLAWNELHNKGFRPDGVTIATIFRRLERIEDPWRNFWQDAAPLKKVHHRIEDRHVA